MSGEASPAGCLSPSDLSNHAPKYGTVIPNRIFVGGIAPNTNETELKSFFSSYGAVKDSKIIADRAGVSKGYGFVTFETQEDAEKIIKKESENLIFKDRKLNIGPAVRKQQAFPRLFDAASPQSMLFAGVNGVPYSYHNGMAVFQSDGSYASAAPLPQAQPAAYHTMVMPQPVYISQPPQYTYQPQTPQPWQTYRFTAQSPTAAAVGNPAGYAAMYPAMQSAGPELLYAQPGIYGQPADISEVPMMEAAPAEGGLGGDCDVSSTVARHPRRVLKFPVTAPRLSGLAATLRPIRHIPGATILPPPNFVANQTRYVKKIVNGTPINVIERMDMDASVESLSSYAPPTPPPTPLARSPDSMETNC